ncbi:MAG: hypothetical protein ACJAYN_003040 [Bermanella sp.]|jgi:hypothetical protein|uniref:hypothetical protein n=1 Tax=Glaciecola sp. 33A TaxID=2057807 RepID=UPI000C341F8F|nr:hypothetical protein [Glaciecola sp. 33A]PKI01199.1 hypothetical protein CXF81_11825 [Glaciecola sp. 33A]
MHKTKLERTFEFFKAITFGNLVGGLATFIIAFVIFFVWKNQATNGQQSVFNDALNVSIFLFPVGLMYSLIVISPIAILLKNRKRAFQICGFFAAVVPSLLLIGNGYWDVLALTYGIVTMLLFLRLYSTDQP